MAEAVEAELSLSKSNSLCMYSIPAVIFSDSSEISLRSCSVFFCEAFMSFKRFFSLLLRVDDVMYE